jgi:hypothetical protein
MELKLYFLKTLTLLENETQNIVFNFGETGLNLTIVLKRTSLFFCFSLPN